MAHDYTTNGLIESVKRRASIPLNQATFTAAKILAFGTDEMFDTVVPLIRRHRNDHFVTYEDVTTTAGDNELDIPEEAMNRGLFNVAMLDGSGNPYSLIRVDFDREIDVPWSHDRPGYYVRGDKLYLWYGTNGTVPAGETVRMYFERIPNRLCLSQAYTVTGETAEAGRITSINTGTGVITCSGGVPSSITTSTPICCVSHLPGFGLKFSAVTPSAVTSTTVTVSTANATLAAVSNWIALDGDSPIIQLPVETHSILAQAVTVKCLESIGDFEAMQLAQQKLDMSKREYGEGFTQRVDKGPKIILNRHRLADYM
jgi:hypothetical protein